MKTKYIKISDKAREELENAQIKGDTLIFVDKITKYSEIKKLFPEIGVTWDKKTKTHYFSNGPEKLLSFLEGKEVIDQKKSFQAFFTPPKIAARAVELAEVNGKSVLEPSCGDGRIVREMIVRGADVHGIELNKDNLTALEGVLKFAKGAGRSFNFSIGMDFLSFTSDDAHFDRIVMNPPFSANQDIAHVEHAYKFLKKGGKLVAIMSGNTTRKKFQDFIKGKNYRIEEIEAGAFAESGTNVTTIILIVNK